MIAITLTLAGLLIFFLINKCIFEPRFEELENALAVFGETAIKFKKKASEYKELNELKDKKIKVLEEKSELFNKLIDNHEKARGMKCTSDLRRG